MKIDLENLSMLRKVLPLPGGNILNVKSIFMVCGEVRLKEIGMQGRFDVNEMASN